MIENTIVLSPQDASALDLKGATAVAFIPKLFNINFILALFYFLSH